MKVWLVWTVSDEDLGDLLLSVWSSEQAALDAIAQYKVGDEFSEFWVNDWAVNT